MGVTRPIQLGLLLSLLSACGSTQYKPIKSPRVSVTSDGFVRDGVTYPAGLGGGLVEAVHGNPSAEEDARKAKGLLIGSVVCLGGAVVSMGTGFGLVVAGTKTDESTGKVSSTPVATVGGILLLGSLALDVVGLILAHRANARAHDAINIYNDGVELQRPSSPPPAVGPRAELAR
jgi:hypothetical protein